MNEVWTAIIPILQTVVIALGIWRIQVVVGRSESKRKSAEECREKYQLLMLRCSGASIGLGKVTAKALRDGHTNGDVKGALEYAEKVEHEQEDFIKEQVTQKII